MRANLIAFALLLSISGFSAHAAEKSFIVGDSYINKKSDLKRYSFQSIPIGIEIEKAIKALKSQYPNAYTVNDKVLLIPQFLGSVRITIP